ncbi:hypothetical protein GCM10010145_37870 [Streptomyces ruber]|uniref:Uncharacterized protein n=1 Tax=Streptomyces ruber TaxID=83378 RepID=A0A918BHR8_9ACTN|nr:hypothetical protein GCM10010145_37870 [Streptomyces ruber]
MIPASPHGVADQFGEDEHGGIDDIGSEALSEQVGARQFPHGPQVGRRSAEVHGEALRIGTQVVAGNRGGGT